MKRKISLLISALCALGACASFTACMADSQNGTDENIGKARTNTHIVEQQDEENNGLPDNGAEEKPQAPDMENMPPMPEFRFIPPHPEHMPSPANLDENAEGEDGSDKNNDGENNDNDENKDSETPEEDKKPPKHAPHKRGRAKPKMPKTGK